MANAGTLKRLVVGRRMASYELDEELLPKRLALPMFASDPLSSVAYATEAALVVLLATSYVSRGVIIPLSMAIAALLAVVVLSYRQTIIAYPQGGGAYTVARDNLGTIPSLIAASSLLVDYVLTVAVSVVAGVLAITSVFPGLAPHAVALSLVSVVVLLIGNLRGLRESGLAFALPTYVFIVAMFGMLAYGFFKGITGDWPQATVPHPLSTGTAATVGVLVVFKAFASGCSALTGVEAISNGVSAFKRPQAQNASRTLMIMGGIAVVLFMGVSYLADKVGARPSESVSVLSEIARAIFPEGSATSFGFYLVQAGTFGVLFLAANAAYQGFPRLSALLAKDGYMPRQFQSLGDRLVFSNGLIAVTAAAALLIVIFDASVEALIHLYLLGVFAAFTLSQAGMVRLWWRRRAEMNTPQLVGRMGLNGFGASLTGFVLVIVIGTKFHQGAWMVTVAIPVLVTLSLLVAKHYRTVTKRLLSDYRPRSVEHPGPVILVVPAIDDASLEALRYTASLVGRNFHPIHVSRTGDTGISRVWNTFHNDYQDGVPPLTVLPMERSLSKTVFKFAQTLEKAEHESITVVVPELFNSRSIRAVIQTRRLLALRLKLLKRPGFVVTDVPIVAGSTETHVPVGETRTMSIVVPLSGITEASLRALDYAMTLRGEDAKALYVDIDDDETQKLKSRWSEIKLPMLLQILPSPYRDLSEPLLTEIRKRTADPHTVCMVVMPEIVVTRWWQRFLHNQRALMLKRMLLFEERVIVTSVPFVL